MYAYMLSFKTILTNNFVYILFKTISTKYFANQKIIQHITFLSIQSTLLPAERRMLQQVPCPFLQVMVDKILLNELFFSFFFFLLHSLILFMKSVDFLWFEIHSSKRNELLKTLHCLYLVITFKTDLCVRQYNC